jgi:hypothetical protein
MSGAASHVYPYGNVIQVKEDVRLWGYQIQVGTPTGTFDSVIYEWNNGSFGQPLFREVINANASGIMNLSYRGTLLKAGKKYYIGRNDPQRNNSSAGNAGVYRKRQCHLRISNISPRLEVHNSIALPLIFLVHGITFSV